MKKTLPYIIYLVILVALVFFFRDAIVVGYLRLREHFLPCQSPITYSIGTFDTKFGISKSDFLATIKQAEDIWEKPIGIDLFKSETNGILKVNLLYDYRQKVTQKLQTLGFSVDRGKESYDQILARYKELDAKYKQDQTAFTNAVALLKVNQESYNKQVSAWNNRRNGTKAQYDNLEQARQKIQAEIDSVNQMQVALNAEVDNLNALIATLNTMAKELNLNVDKLNEVSSTLGEEFEEGLYKSGPDGVSIDIFQYESKAKLVRVLAHELGHALDIPHLDDPNAIMYKLNQGTNEKLTANDLRAIKDHCGIK